MVGAKQQEVLHTPHYIRFTDFQLQLTTNTNINLNDRLNFSIALLQYQLNVTREVFKQKVKQYSSVAA